jgi:Rrf2 family protein
MISASAEYALRAIVCLAGGKGAPLTSQTVAQLSRVPAGYLAKILQQLVKAGLVTSQRGLNGGFALARPPERITLLDVVQVSDPSRRIHNCPLGIAAHGARLCPLHRRLDQAIAMAEHALDEVNVAELLAQSEAAERNCESGCLGPRAHAANLAEPLPEPKVALTVRKLQESFK